MAAMAGLTVYNMPTSPPNLDRVGVFYLSFCVIWTTLLLAGMIFCLVNRHIPILRVRGLPLSFSAITILHVYWILGQISYPVGATVSTVIAYDIQFFAMGIYYPLGIALFQASNIRFLHVAKMQKQFVHPELQPERKCKDANSSWLCRLKNMDYMKRTLSLIGIGIVLQVCSFALKDCYSYLVCKLITNLLVYHHGGDVACMQKVSPNFRYFGDRDSRRDSRRADCVSRPRMGMVAMLVMAGNLDMDCEYPSA